MEEVPAPVLGPEDLERLYNEITEPFPTAVGKAISKKEREESRMFISRLTYGETDFHSFGSATLNFELLIMYSYGAMYTSGDIQ